MSVYDDRRQPIVRLLWDPMSDVNGSDDTTATTLDANAALGIIFLPNPRAVLTGIYVGAGVGTDLIS